MMKAISIVGNYLDIFVLAAITFSLIFLLVMFVVQRFN
jgi:hypothetical protein